MESIREGMSGRKVAQIIDGNFKYLEDKIDNFTVAQYNQLLDRVVQAEQYVIDATTNQVILADNEDTAVVGGLLKLADRPYKADGLSGKGFKILRQRLYAVTSSNCPFNEMGTDCEECCECCIEDCINESIIPNKYIRNVLLQEDFNHSNTIFIVRYDFDLNGKELVLLDDCEIRFEGGTFKNGTLNLNNAKVLGMVGDYKDYFTDVKVKNPHSAQASLF